jgi:drug/metabolite transporter (DMT)-like permease
MSARSLRAFVFLFLATIIWAIASPVIKFTLQGIEPMTFLVYRFGLSAIFATFVLFINKKNIRIRVVDIPMIVLFCLFSTTISLVLLFLGLDKSTVLNLTLIGLIGPLLVEVASSVFLHEHITKREKIGAGIAFIGTLFTIIEPILQSGGALGGFEGNILIISSMLFDITAIIFLKKLLRRNYSPEILTSTSFIIGFIALVPIYFFTHSLDELVFTIRSLPLPYTLGVIYMALFSGTIAYWLRARAQKTVKVEQTALFGYLGPLISVPLAVVWLGESITPLFVVGGIIVATGVIFAEFKFKQD